MSNDNFTTYRDATCAVHNSLLRGAMQIVKFSDEVKEPEFVSFLTYCDIWSDFLHHHHHMEEEVVFPFINERSKGAVNLEQIEANSKDLVQQHEQLLSDLDQFTKLAKETKPTAETIKTLKTLAQKIHDFLQPHFDQEINTVTSRENLSHMVDNDFKDLMLNIEKANKNAAPQRSLIYLLVHLNADERSTFNFPWIVRVILAPIWSWKYQAAWKYAPFTL